MIGLSYSAILMGIGMMVIAFGVYLLTKNEKVRSSVGIFNMFAYTVILVVMVELVLGCIIHCTIMKNEQLRIFPDVMMTSSGFAIHTHILHDGPHFSGGGLTIDLWGLMILNVAISLPLIAFATSRHSTRRLLHRYVNGKNDSLTKTLQKKYGSHDISILVSGYEDLEAFSINNSSQRGKGSAKDLVVINEMLVHHLEDDELEAVIAHERAHIIDRDDRFYPLYNSLRILLFFDPVIQRTIRRFVRRKELRADRNAALTTRKPLALARALIKIYEGRAKTKSEVIVTLIRDNQNLLKERVDQLLRIAEEMEADGHDQP